MDAHLAKLLLRIGFGGAMLTHGIPKLLDLINGDHNFADPFGIGPIATLILTVFAEFVCAAFVLIGFKTKASTVPLIITMLVAVFIIHGEDSFRTKELAVLYAIGYMSIAILGAGKYSIDKK
jgi:putative oxidoreductase